MATSMGGNHHAPSVWLCRELLQGADPAGLAQVTDAIRRIGLPDGWEVHEAGDPMDQAVIGRIPENATRLQTYLAEHFPEALPDFMGPFELCWQRTTTLRSLCAVCRITGAEMNAGRAAAMLAYLHTAPAGFAPEIDETLIWLETRGSRPDALLQRLQRLEVEAGDEAVALTPQALRTSFHGRPSYAIVPEWVDETPLTTRAKVQQAAARQQFAAALQHAIRRARFSIEIPCATLRGLGVATRWLDVVAGRDPATSARHATRAFRDAVALDHVAARVAALREPLDPLVFLEPAGDLYESSGDW